MIEHTSMRLDFSRIPALSDFRPDDGVGGFLALGIRRACNRHSQ